MNFAFNNLLGAPYRGGTLLIHNNELLTPVGNRVGQVSLTESVSKCLPFENLTQIRVLCISPDGVLLMSVDKDGRALLINRKRQVLLHHFSFKGPVACARFSPDGRYLAVAVGRLVQVGMLFPYLAGGGLALLHCSNIARTSPAQNRHRTLLQVWLAPSLDKQMSPMQLYRTYGQSHTDVLDVAWSPQCDGGGGSGGGAGGNEYFIAAACRDGTLRVFSLDPIPGYEPPALGGHKEAVLGVFFASQEMLRRGAAAGAEAEAGGWTPASAGPPVMYSISADGALHCWTYAVSTGNQYGNLATHVAAKRRRDERVRQQQQQRKEGQEAEDGAEEEEEGEGEGEEEAGEGEEEDGQGKRRKKRAQQEKPKRQTGVDGAEEEEEEEEAGAAEAQRQGEVGSAPTAAAAAVSGSGDTFPRLAGGKWYLSSKHYLSHAGARITAYDVHPPSGILAVGFSSGVFELHQLTHGSVPGSQLTCLHTLSASRERLTSLAFNHTGDWLAVGCARLGQLLVWEWRSESYVLKQQGHHHDIATCAFSPDGVLIATGADDCKVKLFQQSTGFCFVTFSDHTAPVTALAFLPSGAALLSASLDGTVRAWDLVRYRNFRTLTSPTPAQYGSVAVDPGGEVVVAGTLDTFQVCVWSLKTGRLLDVLSGHEGPVTGLAFSPVTSLLASASWDRTVRTWDVYDSGGGASADVLEHRHDVLAVAMRPDGRQLAAAAADGSIYLWDPIEGELQGTIEGRRDIRGGRLAGDRRAASNSSSDAAFTSLAFSADGALLLAGGNSKFVCVYDVAERLLLRRFQISHNRSLDGVLDQLNTKNMTDAGPLQLINQDDGDDVGVELLPPSTDLAASADVPGTSAGKRPVVRCRCVALSPTGRVWAAASTEGLLLYGTDDGLIFDPTDLNQDITPAAVHSSLAAGAHLRALLIALRLSDPGLVRHVLLETPPSAVQTTAAGLPPVFVPAVLGALAECAAQCPHLEFVLSWVRTVCTAHGGLLKAAASGGGGGGAAAARVAAGGGAAAAALMPVLRSLQKVLGGLHGDLAAAAEGNMYSLEYLAAAGTAAGTASKGEES